MIFVPGTPSVSSESQLTGDFCQKGINDKASSQRFFETVCMGKTLES